MQQTEDVAPSIIRSTNTPLLFYPTTPLFHVAFSHSASSRVGKMSESTASPQIGPA
jgi:hypothetical protein